MRQTRQEFRGSYERGPPIHVVAPVQRLHQVSRGLVE